MCLQDVLTKNQGNPTFVCEDDEDQIPVALKEKAEDYPKNFTLLKMAQRYQK